MDYIYQSLHSFIYLRLYLRLYLYPYYNLKRKLVQMKDSMCYFSYISDIRNLIKDEGQKATTRYTQYRAKPLPSQDFARFTSKADGADGVDGDTCSFVFFSV